MTQRFLLVLGLFLIVSGCVGTSTGTGSNGTTTGSGTTTVNISNVSVTGTVTDSSGSALTNVDVYVTESERNDWGTTLEQTITDAQGNYDIPTLPPGEYRIFFIPQTEAMRSDVITIGTQTLYTNASLEGPHPLIVVVKNNGVPFKGAMVRLIQGGKSRFGNPTNAAGEYPMTQLPAGQYDVLVSLYDPVDGLLYYKESITLPLTNPVVAIDYPNTHTNILVEAEDAGSGQAIVGLKPEIVLDGGYVFIPNVVSQDLKSYVFSGLPVESFTLKVSAQGYRDYQEQLSLTAGDNPLNIKMVKR